MRKMAVIVMLINCLAACGPAPHEPEEAMPNSSPTIVADSVDHTTEREIEDGSKFRNPVDID